MKQAKCLRHDFEICKKRGDSVNILKLLKYFKLFLKENHVEDKLNLISQFKRLRETSGKF